MKRIKLKSHLLNKDEAINADAGVLLEGITGYMSYGKINIDFSLDYRIDFKKSDLFAKLEMEGPLLLELLISRDRDGSEL